MSCPSVRICSAAQLCFCVNVLGVGCSCVCVRIVFLLCRFGRFILELDFILERFVDLNLWFGPLRGNSRDGPDRRTENEL